MIRRTQDPARRLAFDALRQVYGEGAYANLALAKLLATQQLDERDAAFATELVSGTTRWQGTYDAIIELASGRKLASLQPAVVDLLRLGTHQLLGMRLPTRAAVAATVNLAGLTVGERVTGLVNAVLRKIAANDRDAWIALLKQNQPDAALGIATGHPQWIADAYVDLLGSEEAERALEANNVAATPTLVIRPGLAEVGELVGATPTTYSPFGAHTTGNPSKYRAVREGRAGVQDEGSQLVTLALTRASAPEGPWLDVCAGPGGKSALLAGLAGESDQWLLANEAQPHRAELVSRAIAGYENVTVTCADGTAPAWRSGAFARVLADVPCTGLGALRRRPESRWRRSESDLAQLAPLQRQLLDSAISAAAPGGVIGYVTCSPHRAETSEVVADVMAGRSDVELLDAASFLPEVPDAALGKFIQLWPHRHNTDAMFCALLRRVS